MAHKGWSQLEPCCLPFQSSLGFAGGDKEGCLLGRHREIRGSIYVMPVLVSSPMPPQQADPGVLGTLTLPVFSQSEGQDSDVL